MRTCDICGGLEATEPSETIAGTPCQCALAAAPVRCQYCKFWKAEGDDQPYWKTCHRYPPTGKMQPHTHPATWCGEFQPNNQRSHGDPSKETL
jgi:hypothetical protein